MVKGEYLQKKIIGWRTSSNRRPGKNDPFLLKRSYPSTAIHHEYARLKDRPKATREKEALKRHIFKKFEVVDKEWHLLDIDYDLTDDPSGKHFMNILVYFKPATEAGKKLRDKIMKDHWWSSLTQKSMEGKD